MRDPNFRFTKKTDKGSDSYEGDYIYRSLRYKYTLHRQGEKQIDGSKRKTQYRGRIIVCSPKDGHPMEFKAAHRYGEKKEAKVKYREFSTTSVKRDAVKAAVEKVVKKIHSENALTFSRLIQETVRPDTMYCELAGELYGLEYTNYRFKAKNTEATMSKKHAKLVKMLSLLPAKPMIKITEAEARKCLNGCPKADISLLYDFWNYCIAHHYCLGENPISIPAHGGLSSVAKQNKLQMLTRVPKRNLKRLNDFFLNSHNGPNCGVVLMESGFSSKDACGFRWKDISWPTNVASYALVKYVRQDVMCAIHDYSRPLLPVAAEVLFLRHKELLEQYSVETLAEMPVVSTKSNPEKPISSSALVQESKRSLIAAGIENNRLLQAKESRGDPVSARILNETYKDILRDCGIQESSGTYKFLLGQAIFNDVTSSNYVSFTSPAGSLRLWQYLRAAAPVRENEEILHCRSKDGIDSWEVSPPDTSRCAGLIADIVLQPGQEIVLESEFGASFSVETHDKCDTNGTIEDNNLP